ncbi:ATP-grasp domain-containing protein [Dickeya poaceiphila]|nr:ATP-grasp domain-containing protein [Dickeya poaceiphila]
MKYLIFVESNTTGTGEIFLERASKAGYEPVLMYRDGNRYHFLNKAPFRTIKVDTSNIDHILHSVASELGTENVAGVWSTSEYYISTASELASLLNLPSLDCERIKAVRNKKFQREQLNRHQLSYTPFSEITDKAAVLHFVHSVGFPVIIKPVDCSGSVGVLAISDENELLRALSTVFGSSVSTTEWIIEKYYPGEQYSVEVFNSNIVGITHQHYDYFPRMIAVGHDFPALLETEKTTALTTLIGRVISLFGLTSGPVHIEVRFLQDENIKIIEVNPRLAGGYIPEIFRLSTGSDLIKACIDYCTGNIVDLSKPENNFSAIRFIVKGNKLNHRVFRCLKEKCQEAVLCFDENKRKESIFHGDFRDRYGHIIVMTPNVSAREDVIEILNNSSYPVMDT